MSGKEARGADQFEFAEAPAEGSKWNVYMADIYNEQHGEVEAPAVFADLTFDTDPVSAAAEEPVEPVLLVIANQDFYD